MLNNSRFEDNQATNSGGAIAIRGGSVAMVASSFIRNSAGSNGGVLHITGGVARMSEGPMLVDNRAQNGGAISLAQPSASVDVQDATLSNNIATTDGGALLVKAGIARVIGGRIEANAAGREGGAASIGVGTLMLMDRAAMRGNVAPVGSAVSVGTGELRYVLPAPVGYWIAASKICRLDGPMQPCHADADPNAMVGRVYSTLSASMLDEDYPLTCAAGLYGTNDTVTQIRSSCAGECVAGTYSRAGSSLEGCILCGPGTFCESGSPSETPVLSGRYSNQSGVGSVRETWECPVGHECMGGTIVPTKCGVGFHGPRTGLGACLPCDAGSYQDETGTLSCKTCTPGHYCPTGSFVPTPCTAGKWSSQRGLRRESECNLCNVSHFCLEGSTEPTVCPAGVFGKTAQLRDAKCSGPCAPGHFCPRGSSVADAIGCPSGTYNPLAGQGDVSACLPCKVAHYCTEGTAQPSPCSNLAHPGFTTLSEGAKGPSACVCLAATFRDSLQPPAGWGLCTECPEGANCHAAGAELGALPLFEGYWRAFNFSAVPRGCPREMACLPGIPDEDWRASAKSPGRANCEVGYTGVLCATCDEGFYATSEFSNCTSCAGVGSPEPYIIGGSVLAGVFVLVQILGCVTQVRAQRAKQRKVLENLKAKGFGGLGKPTPPPSPPASPPSQPGEKGEDGEDEGEEEGKEEGEKGDLSFFPSTPSDPSKRLGCIGRIRKKVRAMRNKAQEMQDKKDEAEGTADGLKSAASGLLALKTMLVGSGGGGGGGGGAGGLLKGLGGLLKGLGSAKTKIRIIFGNVQILTNLSAVFSINFPPMFASLLEMGSICNLDLFTLLPMGCWQPDTNYHSMLVSRTLMPLIVVGALSLSGFALDFVADRGIASGRLRQVDHLVAISDRLQSHAVVILFVAFPGSCVAIFRTFPCLTLDDGTRWLSADLSVDCDSDAHAAHLLYAFVMLLMYPLGVPALQIYLLRFRYREHLEHMQTLAAISKHQSASEMYNSKKTRRPRPRVQGLGLRGVRRVPIGFDKHTVRKEISTKASASASASPPPSPPSSPPPQGFPIVQPVPSQADVMTKAMAEATTKLATKSATSDEALLALPKPVRNLVVPYGVNAAWFEVFETLRKLMLIGPPIFFEAGSATQMIVGLLIAFISGMTYMAFRPYPEAGEDLLSQVAQVQIFFIHAPLSSGDLGGYRHGHLTHGTRCAAHYPHDTFRDTSWYHRHGEPREEQGERVLQTAQASSAAEPLWQAARRAPGHGRPKGYALEVVGGFAPQQQIAGRSERQGPHKDRLGHDVPSVIWWQAGQRRGARKSGEQVAGWVSQREGPRGAASQGQEHPDGSASRQAGAGGGTAEERKRCA